MNVFLGAPLYGLWGASGHTCPFFPWIPSPCAAEHLQQKERGLRDKVGVTMIFRGSQGTHKPLNIIQYPSDINNLGPIVRFSFWIHIFINIWIYNHLIHTYRLPGFSILL